MRTYSKVLLVVLVVAGFVFPLFVNGPDGRPLMTMDDWLPDFRQLKQGAEQLTGIPSGPPSAGKDKGSARPIASAAAFSSD